MVESSFASTMSLNSPSTSFQMPGNQFLPPGRHFLHSPMDVSPCPQSYGYSKTNASIGLHLDVPGQQPRPFGRDVGNSPTASNDDSKGRQRSALPFEWMAASPLHRLNKSSTASTLIEVRLLGGSTTANTSRELTHLISTPCFSLSTGR